MEEQTPSLQRIWSRNRSAPRRSCCPRGPAWPDDPWRSFFFGISTGSACLHSEKRAVHIAPGFRICLLKHGDACWFTGGAAIWRS